MPQEWIVFREYCEKYGYPCVIRIPKQTVKLSCRRNRIRRLIREALRLGKLSPAEGVEWSFRVIADPPKEIKVQEVMAVLSKIVPKKKRKQSCEES